MREEASLRQSVKSLGSVLKSMNSLVPGVVVVAALLIFSVALLAIKAGAMVGLGVLIVFLVAIAIYAKTTNYGEAALSIVAGLLAVFTVEWNAARFMAFVAAWAGFTLVVFLVSSVRLASTRGEIYTQAAIALADGTNDDTIGGRLESIAEDADCLLDPIERAEVIRVFALRRLPTESMGDGLEAVDKLATVTGANHLQVATFIADVFRIFSPEGGSMTSSLIDDVYTRMRDSRVPPQEYIVAFEACKRLVLSEGLDAQEFLNGLGDALDGGVPPEEMNDYLAEHLGSRNFDQGRATT